MLSHEVTIILMTAFFVLGYIFITIEHYTKINKATIALLMAIVCWALYFADRNFLREEGLIFLGEHVGNISQLIFFLLGALTVVETINVHRGFKTISDLIQVHSKKSFLWTVGLITFFLSGILDNLTTTIVMIVLLQKLIPKTEDRLIIGGGVVIAANAGGAWTPIGDVTTTMLWIGGQISTFQVMRELFLASVGCVIVSLAILSLSLKGSFTNVASYREREDEMEPFGKLIFFLGIGLLAFVPVFKALTGLPPFMGILFALGVLWLITDLLHRHLEERSHLRVPAVLSKIDLAGILFFLGILLCVDALESVGILDNLAHFFDYYFNNLGIVAVIIGAASAIIDNVPLVAATMSMYDVVKIPQDDSFWQLVAYAAGTGGSMLIIGSAAGIVFMGLEKVDFLWYFKRISLSATLGYIAGILIFYAQQMLQNG